MTHIIGPVLTLSVSLSEPDRLRLTKYAEEWLAYCEEERREEREACAKICDTWARAVVHPEISSGLAAAIRGRGE